jgi:cell division protein ZapA (FtsZ GTPase activity inhibitor)
MVHEGWDVRPTEVDRACVELARAGFLILVPEDPGADLAGGRMVLSRTGCVRAHELAAFYLGGPLRSWVRVDPAFEDMGQIEVDFLGSRFVIGCVEGEEAKTLRLAERFEIDAGEVTKAVSADLDDVRAMLMAGVLAYERLEELEDSRGTAPASDRLVGLDHNSANYITATQTLDALIVVVRDSNRYREEDGPDQERRLAELEAGRTLLRSRWVSTATVKAALWGTLAYLATKFADAPIGEAATLAWNAVKHLLAID